ncbi:unnamed protein product, partial [Tilletia controversa]
MSGALAVVGRHSMPDCQPFRDEVHFAVRIVVRRMFAKLAVAGLAAASIISAAPLVQKRQSESKPDIDVIILNYALTLEHLENAFYRDT